MKKSLLFVVLASVGLMAWAQSLKGAVPDTTEAEIFDLGYEQSPRFPGGDTACMAFVAENLQYPKEAEKWNVTGRLLIQFVVDKDGSIRDGSIKPFRFYVKKMDGVQWDTLTPEQQVEQGARLLPIFGKEGERVVRLMPKWEPGGWSENGILTPRPLRMTLPMKFER